MAEEQFAIFTVKGLSKSYGGINALRNVNLDIPKGNFILLLGPNGAGKSTLLKILSTVLKPTEGNVYVSDKILNNKKDIRNSIGFVSHESYLYENLSAYENLIFFANLYGLDNPEERTDYLLRKMHMDTRAHELVKNYSQGMKQRTALCRAIIHNPEFLILDEPFNSLDLSGVAIITGLLKDLKSEGKTILISTHNYDSTIELADRILILVEGELKLNTELKISKDKIQEIYTQSVN